MTARARDDRELFRVLTVGRKVVITAPTHAGAIANCGPDLHVLYVDGRTYGRADQWPSAERFQAFARHIDMYRAHLLTGSGEQIVGYQYPTLWAALIALVLEYDWRES